MSEPIVWLTIFVLSVFVGVEVISKVSSTLHTPLMSGANAIHGIILLGAILVSGYAQNVVNLVTLMTREGAWNPDFEDEIVAGSCVTHDGHVWHEPTRTALEGEQG